MIELSKHTRHLHHHLKINNECKLDIAWRLEYLPKWNGISIFYDDVWSNNDKLHLWTDASNAGYGAYFQGQWIMQSYIGTLSSQTSRPIAWRELYAIVSAANTWGKQLKGKRIQFHCENQAVVYILCNGTSRDKDLMV